MSYPTQEDELRAKEAHAESAKRIQEAGFLSTFENLPKNNATRLPELARNVVNSFNSVMENSRLEPYERQEEIMSGLRRLLEEEKNVIEAKIVYSMKLNPATAANADKRV
jgi:F0F1-type ATP synthase delta subunit